MNLDHNDAEFTSQVWVYDHVNILHELPINGHKSDYGNGGEELILEWDLILQLWMEFSHVEEMEFW